jgi:hypothetical protein
MESEELIVETLKEAPTGDTPNTGDTVVIHYGRYDVRFFS